jgi:hypothetical protein
MKPVCRIIPALLIIAFSPFVIFAEQHEAARATQELKIESIEVVVRLDGEKTVYLPGSAIESIRKQLDLNPQMQCFSVNVQKADKKLWIPLRKPGETPKIVPGRKDAEIRSIRLQLTSPPLSPDLDWIWIGLGEGRKARFKKTGDATLEFVLKDSEKDLENIPPAELISSLIREKATIPSDSIGTGAAPEKRTPEGLGENLALRPDTTIKLDLGEGKEKAEVRISSSSYVEKGKVFILAGETFSVEFDVEGGKLVNPRYVTEVKNPKRTLRLSMTQDRKGTILRTSHGFSKTLLSSGETMSVGAAEKKFDSRPLKAGVENLETFDPTVVMIVLQDFRFEN